MHLMIRFRRLVQQLRYSRRSVLAKVLSESLSRRTSQDASPKVAICKNVKSAVAFDNELDAPTSIPSLLLLCDFCTFLLFIYFESFSCVNHCPNATLNCSRLVHNLRLKPCVRNSVQACLKFWNILMSLS